ncbi:MAG: APC family permease [Streptomycetales bacterium]
MATTTSAPQTAEDRGLRRDIGAIGLLFTGVGSIIGSGWLFSALYASQLAGPAAILSWVLGGVMIILIGFTYAELGATFPVAGGVIRFPQFAFGSFASYSAGWITWLAAAAVTPIEVLATLQYATVIPGGYFTGLLAEEAGVPVLTSVGLVVSIILMFIYSLINVMGVRAFARFNNVLVWWKLFIILAVVVIFLAAAFNVEHFSSPELGGFAPNGYEAVFTALPSAGIVFAYLGFRQGVEFAGESSNPKKIVPIAVVGSIIITGIIYIALQIAFIGALPSETLSEGWSNLSFANDFGPLAGLSVLLGITILAWALYIDAVISPADTGLIYAGVTARLSYAQARNGNAPQALTKLNSKGVPWVSVALMFVVGCIFFLPYPAWQKLVGFIVSATVLSFGSGPLVLAALRRQLPHQERPYKLIGGDTIPFLAFLSSNLIVYWTDWSQNIAVFGAVLLGYVLFAIYLIVAKDRTPPLEFRSGWWFLPWFAGLALLSWAGRYGGQELLPMWWDLLVVAIFSAVIYALAVASRLAPEKVVENIQRTPQDEKGAIGTP